MKIQGIPQIVLNIFLLCCNEWKNLLPHWQLFGDKAFFTFPYGVPEGRTNDELTIREFYMLILTGQNKYI